MTKHMIVLGTVHPLQGAEKSPKPIVDPMYRSFVKSTIKDEKVDFVFEEANPDEGRTVAEDIARDALGIDHYSLIDPSRDQRASLGIGETSDWSCFNPMDDTVEVKDWLCTVYVEEHKKREEHWLKVIQGKQFNRGLLICGDAHVLSMSYRFLSENFSVEAYSYVPYHRLCEKKHER